MTKIVFDLDGTLLDSSQRHAIVLRDCLTESGYLEMPLGYLEFKADGYSTECYLLEKMQLEPVECHRIAELWVQRIEKKEYLKYDLLYDDAIPVIEECVRKGHQLYLVSARQNSEHFMWQVNHLKLDRFFEGIFCVPVKDAAKGKALKIEALGADLIIGDTESEWKAAAAVNIPCYTLNRGFRSKHYWDRIGVESHTSLWSLFDIFEF